MKRIIVTSMFLLALITPNYFLGYKQVCHLEGSSSEYAAGSRYYRPNYQPISLKEQAFAKLGKAISEEHLAQLKVSASPEIFEPVFKKALLQAATTEPNIWDAADKIKELAATFHEEEILNDPELNKELISTLANKYKIDFEIALQKASKPSITQEEAFTKAQGMRSHPYSYLKFAAEILNTPGAEQWFRENILSKPGATIGIVSVSREFLVNPFPKAKKPFMETE